jgi:hypothetical protein
MDLPKRVALDLETEPLGDTLYALKSGTGACDGREVQVAERNLRGLSGGWLIRKRDGGREDT